MIIAFVVTALICVLAGYGHDKWTHTGVEMEVREDKDWKTTTIELNIWYILSIIMLVLAISSSLCTVITP